MSFNRSAGWSRSDEPFDVTVDTARALGWFPAAAMRVDEQRPAALTVSPDSYRLDATLDEQGGKVNEWVILDRIEGRLTHNAQRTGMPTENLRRAGTCRKLEPRF